MSDSSFPAIEPRVERVARAIASAVCGGNDSDTVVVPSWPGPLRFAAGAFTIVPQHGQPLWTWFVGAAREAIRVGDERQ